MYPKLYIHNYEELISPSVYLKQYFVPERSRNYQLYQNLQYSTHPIFLKLSTMKKNQMRKKYIYMTVLSTLGMEIPLKDTAHYTDLL